jgi:hypothetical protein
MKVTNLEFYHIEMAIFGRRKVEKSSVSSLFIQISFDEISWTSFALLSL